MVKALNIVFVVICMVLFCSVIIYKGCNAIDVLPPALDNGERSYVEGRTLQKVPKPTTKAILNKSFQSKTETWLSDCFPARDRVLLSYSALQRGFIQVANIPCGYDVYLTYYGSERAYSVSNDAIFELPEKATDGKRERGIEESARAIDELSRQYPNMNIVFFLPDNSAYSNSNPVTPYISDVLDKSYYEQFFLDQTGENVIALTQDYGSTKEYLDNYYATDHHWNIFGTYEGYRSIAEALDYTPLPIPTETISLKQSFYGSNSRSALYIKEGWEQLIDKEFDFPEYVVTQNDKEITRNDKESFLKDSDKPLHSYMNYFGLNSSSPLIYTVKANEDKGNLLLISDSYGNAMEPLLASHYYETHVLNMNGIDEKLLDISLEGYIEDNNITDIVFVLNLSPNQTEILPSFLSGG